MVRGNLGSASLRRPDYTVIGDVVNTAQRLQTIAQPNQILISETSYQHIREAFECKKIGEVDLKNKTKTLTIYEVII